MIFTEFSSKDLVQYYSRSNFFVSFLSFHRNWWHHERIHEGVGILGVMFKTLIGTYNATPVVVIKLCFRYVYWWCVTYTFFGNQLFRASVLRSWYQKILSLHVNHPVCVISVVRNQFDKIICWCRFALGLSVQHIVSYTCTRTHIHTHSHALTHRHSYRESGNWL